MQNELTKLFGLDLPLFAFTTSPEVCVAVSRAGGMGVLGAIPYTADELARHLDYIDRNIGGKQYGVDVVMPQKYVGTDEGVQYSKADFDAMIPEKHRKFIEGVLARYGVPPLAPGQKPRAELLSWVHDLTRKQVEVALSHPISLLANALGPPPADVVEHAHNKNIKVAALAGSVRHAKKQVEAGVDIIVAQGTEAGGHTGEIATMVLVPEVVEAVHPVPVLAAGGIGSGRQMAAALALGAAGAWTGSIWLTTTENQLTPSVVKKKLVAATSRDTVRSRAMTGKPARQLRTAWTDAWDAADSPGTLPLPLQFLATADAVTRIHVHAEAGQAGARELLGSAVGQIVGRMNQVRPTAEIVAEIAGELRQTLRALPRE